MDISKAMPSCQKKGQRNVKGKKQADLTLAGLCRNPCQVYVSDGVKNTHIENNKKYPPSPAS